MRTPFAAGLLAATLVAQSVRAQQEVPPTFRAGVDAVAVEAFVVDRDGRPVSGLTREDFELLEDSQPQRITSFSEVNIPIAAPAPYSPTAVEPDVASNAGGEGRLYVMAFDEVPPTDALKARRFLRDFIERHFEGNDIGIVVSVGRARAGDMQDFTGNRRLLLAAIDKFTGGFPIAADEAAALATFATPMPPVDLRSQARALRDLMESLSKIRGRRKAVIYITGQVGDSAIDVAGHGRANVWDVIDYRGGVKSIEFDDLRAAMTAAMRGGISFYTMDPAGLCALDCPSGSENLERMDGLRKLAAATGGFPVVSSNLFSDAFPRIVAENSNYYVLGFTSGNDRRDGRYRQLQVRVNRPGLTVRSRDGYIAPSRTSDRTESKPRAGITLSAGVGESIAAPMANAAVPMSVFAAPYRGKAKEASVVIAINLDATRLGLIANNGLTRGEIETASVAVSAAGKVTRGQRERFTLALKPDTWSSVQATGIRVVTGLALPPGRYQLRVAGGNTSVTPAGSVMYDLEVPDFSKLPLAMSGVTLTSRRVATTFTIASPNVQPVVPHPPAAIRDFTAGDTLMVYAEVYDNHTKDRHELELTAELQTPDGTAVGLPIVETRNGNQPLLKLEAMLSLDVAPGPYILHVQARSTLAKQPTVSRRVPLRVR